MRNDLHQSLERSQIDPAALSSFQRILLTTDGTVTDILEAYSFEKVQVFKISEQVSVLEKDINNIMDLKKGTKVITRKILLQGIISRKNFIYAESILAPERLGKDFEQELLTTKMPIGKIWFERKVETFKEIVDSGKEPANQLATHFNIKPEDKLLFRTYCVFSNQQPTMMITEKFPASYFLKNL